MVRMYVRICLNLLYTLGQKVYISISDAKREPVLNVAWFVINPILWLNKIFTKWIHKLSWYSLINITHFLHMHLRFDHKAGCTVTSCFVTKYCKKFNKSHLKIVLYIQMKIIRHQVLLLSTEYVNKHFFQSFYDVGD